MKKLVVVAICLLLTTAGVLTVLYCRQILAHYLIIRAERNRIYIQDENFDEFEDDFNIVISLLYSYKDYMLSSRFTFLWIIEESNVYKFRHRQEDRFFIDIEIDEYYQDSIRNIAQVFGDGRRGPMNMISFFEEGFVFFTSSESYFLGLVYSIDGGTPYFFTTREVSNRNYNVNKIKDHWYQITHNVH